MIELEDIQKRYVLGGETVTALDAMLGNSTRRTQ